MCKRKTQWNAFLFSTRSMGDILISFTIKYTYGGIEKKVLFTTEND